MLWAASSPLELVTLCLYQLNQELWISGGTKCFPQSLTVHRIEGSLDIYVSYMQGLSKFTDSSEIGL